MARLANPILIRTVELRPSLRAALRIARDYDGFSAVLKGIAEGNTIVLSRLFGECGLSGSALASLFHVPGRSLASRVVELQPIAFELVNDLLGFDPDAKEERKPADPNAKPRDFVDECETLFGLASGILQWTPDAAWNVSVVLRPRRRGWLPAS